MFSVRRYGVGTVRFVCPSCVVLVLSVRRCCVVRVGRELLLCSCCSVLVLLVCCSCSVSVLVLCSYCVVRVLVLCC